jgi:dTDP-glucose 4,6-dehydratase
MERVFITGGAGFLGSHLARKLLEEGFEVICMDNFLTSSKENIADLMKHRNFTLIEGDVTSKVEVNGELKYVVHFASPASPEDYLRWPIHTLKVGSVGTFNTLELAKKKKAVFMLASSSEVYGDPLVHPQSEDYWGNVNPIGPRGVYDEAKRFAEAVTMAYHRSYGMDTKIARIFNTFGPGMRPNDGRAVPTFITQALKGEDITVFGDGSQTRSFCYISDMVDGLLKLLFSSVNIPINLGNPDEVPVIQIAKEVIELTGSPSEIVFRQLPQDDPQVRQPDITAARKLLNWEPLVSRREGLIKTIEYFRKILNKHPMTAH